MDTADGYYDYFILRQQQPKHWLHTVAHQPVRFIRRSRQALRSFVLRQLQRTNTGHGKSTVTTMAADVDAHAGLRRRLGLEPICHTPTAAPRVHTWGIDVLPQRSCQPRISARIRISHIRRQWKIRELVVWDADGAFQHLLGARLAYETEQEAMTFARYEALHRIEDIWGATPPDQIQWDISTIPAS